ncbi:MAG: hypothetical protein LBL99_02930 [Holosporaceae bacterium]|jgi:hypothetical protein|nr:hypothetical protein [Holosporaceae bacterium]
MNIKNSSDKNERPNFALLFSNWRSPFIKRSQLYEATEGLINPKTLRNLDCLGRGIKGKFTIGRRTVAYPVESVIEYLNERAGQSDERRIVDKENVYEG